MPPPKASNPTARDPMKSKLPKTQDKDFTVAIMDYVQGP